MKSQIKAILFDYDDTLVMTRETIWGVLKQVGRKFYNMDLTDEAITKVYGKPYPEMIVELYEHRDSYEIIHKNFMTIRSKTPIPAYDDSLKTIRVLAKIMPVGIITSAIRELAMLDIVRLNFPVNDLLGIQTADDTLVHKPNPKVLEPTLNKLKGKGIKAEETLYVGDAMNDYLAATGAGLQFVGIVRNEINPFAQHQVTVIKSLLELEKLIRI